MRRRRTKSLAVQAAEMAFAAPQVIAHRTARMALGGLTPSARDRKELNAMGAEKAAAFVESWSAMALEAMRINQQLTLSAMQSFWFPWSGTRSRRSVSAQLDQAADAMLRVAMAPVHRRAVANAKRLGRPKRKRT